MSNCIVKYYELSIKNFIYVKYVFTIFKYRFESDVLGLLYIFQFYTSFMLYPANSRQTEGTKTLRSPRSAEFLRYCKFSGATQRRPHSGFYLRSHVEIFIAIRCVYFLCAPVMLTAGSVGYIKTIKVM